MTKKSRRDVLGLIGAGAAAAVFTGAANANEATKHELIEEAQYRQDRGRRRDRRRHYDRDCNLRHDTQDFLTSGYLLVWYRGDRRNRPGNYYVRFMSPSRRINRQRAQQGCDVLDDLRRGRYRQYLVPSRRGQQYYDMYHDLSDYVDALCGTRRRSRPRRRYG